MGLTVSRQDTVSSTDVRQMNSETHEAEALPLHVGQRSQMKRLCRIMRSKLQEVSQGKREALQDCQELAQRLEALLDDASSRRGARSSSKELMPQEVKDWLTKQWTESSARLGEDLSPIRGAGATLRSSRAPFGPELMEVLDKVGTPDIDVVAVQGQPEVAGNVTTVLFMYTLTNGGVFDQLPAETLADPMNAELFQDRLLKFVAAIEQAYLDVPYHNNMHAADVMMMMHSFLLSSNMSWISPIEHLMCLMAAVSHDAGHDGVNNMFHVKAQSLVALRYNDKSVLENMHCALAFELMKENEDLNWLGLMNGAFPPETPGGAPLDLRPHLRRSIIEMVLVTDPTKHNVLMENLKGLVQAKSLPGSHVSLSDPKQKQDAFNVLLHSADVSNATRKLPVALYWSRQVLLEFWAQGDQEKSLGLEVSPLCDRASGMKSVPQGQLGFIGFIVRPLFLELSRLLPEASQLVEQLGQTEEYWKEKKAVNASFEESFALLDR
ncbi:unnamed protein product [Durusdinium trenchii]|uniref:PDEase domain-containing protein n=2 Tax=Durusdinium trenchii TaxID=1381693 RepID=A0ABP0NKB3_9DINO